MDTKVFKLIQDINTEGWDNSIWEILHSNGDKHTCEYFGTINDQVMPEGDYIAVWLKRGSYEHFVAGHTEICWSVITLQCIDPDSIIYIYKV